MKKFYFLSSCDTCKRIMKSLPLEGKAELQDLKTQHISEEELDTLAALAGSYLPLLNKRSRIYKDQGHAEKELTETELKALILSHYTLLTRPVLIYEDHLFTGNSKKTVSEMTEFLNALP